jgi:hypothetical protein
MISCGYFHRFGFDTPFAQTLKATQPTHPSLSGIFHVLLLNGKDYTVSPVEAQEEA